MRGRKEEVNKKRNTNTIEGKRHNHTPGAVGGVPHRVQISGQKEKNKSQYGEECTKDYLQSKKKMTRRGEKRDKKTEQEETKCLPSLRRQPRGFD